MNVIFHSWARMVLYQVLASATALTMVSCTQPRVPEATSLEDAIITARSLLADSQQPGGNWVPELTTSPHYREPVPEPEVTATGMMLSLLRPLSEPYCMQSEVQNAFAFVADQIEHSGLVRFYGRNDHLSPINRGASTSPAQWMSPDLGDTALAWLVAPPLSGRERILDMVAHIDGFRDNRGMFQTWLDDDDHPFMRARVRNPVDIQILFEVYLVLQNQRLEMDTAGEICTFLQEHIDDEQYWVWFRYAPLAPRLTLYDMEVAGCPLEPRAQLLQPTAAHQEDYVWLVDTLIALNRVEYHSPPSAAELRRIGRKLRDMAADDFAEMYNHPALIYNKEVKAPPPGYYWLPDFGLALWLRVAEKWQRFLPDGAERPWCPGIGGHTSEVALQ